MKVLESKPRELVKWKCVGGPPEWIGTEVTFRLAARDGQVFVLFTHAGWKEPVQRAEAHPHPYDVKIHVDD
jgi:hypothetical protein